MACADPTAAALHTNIVEDIHCPMLHVLISFPCLFSYRLIVRSFIHLLQPARWCLHFMFLCVPFLPFHSFRFYSTPLCLSPTRSCNIQSSHAMHCAFHDNPVSLFRSVYDDRSADTTTTPKHSRKNSKYFVPTIPYHPI